MVKNPPANAGDTRAAGSVTGSRRSPGEGNGKPLQYSHLETSMGRGAWRVTVHEVAELDVTEHTSRGHHQHPSGPAGLGLHACVQPAILLSTPTCRGFEDIVVSVDEETEPRPKAALNSLFLPGLCFISCWDKPLGTQGMSWRLNEGCFL